MAKTANTQKTTANDLTQQIKNGVLHIQTSDEFKSYLHTMSKFHNYSLGNTLLIHMQKPGATHVAGFSAWKKLGRYVKKGEHGIAILAPMTKKIKNENGEDEYRNLGFKPVYVFDISQTEGKELPESPCHQLIGDVTDADIIRDATIDAAQITVEYAQLEGTCYGQCFLSDKKVLIREGLQPKHEIKTLVHEAAHAELHAHIDPILFNADVAEVQAEAVAYTVCHHFGIDTDEYSFGYIATWCEALSEKQVTAALNGIHATTAKFIDAIENAFKAESKEAKAA